eukprot:CAMPEP_0184291136 /NCGR_PEP_ID=MMETSP1049-20130417/3226_1 /TAXON_ID=77928 /ORGANISM="Proteomonas sulcata, Strain CCMP704" /LENGTH=122 /DNA_ID=CAMNT_0026598483 /DNA_START=314 /DNA_END=678 /DNA_ORIENTATION=-
MLEHASAVAHRPLQDGVDAVVSHPGFHPSINLVLSVGLWARPRLEDVAVDAEVGLGVSRFSVTTDEHEGREKVGKHPDQQGGSGTRISRELGLVDQSLNKSQQTRQRTQTAEEHSSWIRQQG